MFEVSLRWVKAVWRVGNWESLADGASGKANFLARASFARGSNRSKTLSLLQETVSWPRLKLISFSQSSPDSGRK